MESAYNTYKAAIGKLVGSILGGTNINYLGHRDCIPRAGAVARKEWKYLEMAELARRKELAGGQEKNHLHMATRNGAWLSAITHFLNRMELSQEAFRDNLSLRYGMMPQDIPATCDGYSKKLSIEHTT